MSQLPSIIIKIFSNLIKLNNNEIAIVFDKNKIWFSLRDVFKALGYKDIKKEIKRLEINDEHITSLGKILQNPEYTNSNLETKRHPQTVMIDEPGIYVLLDKSTKPIAKQFRNELSNDILPELREKGSYSFNPKEKQKLINLTKKLKNMRYELKRTKKQSYPNTTKQGFIYVLKVKTIHNGVEKICYKIGYTTNLEKRLATYKTGNPDIELAHQENISCNRKQLESCVKNLNILQLLRGRTEIICDVPLKKIIEEIKDCKKLLNKHT